MEKGIQVGPFSNIESKASAMRQKMQKQSFPKMRKTDDDVYLFIRAKKEYLQRLKNAYIRDKRVVQNTGGEYVGIADTVKRYEGELYRGMPESCITVIRFRDMEHAQRWSQSSRAFKQNDFPTPSDEVEMFAVPVKYLPLEEMPACQLTEMHGMMVDDEEFQSNYVHHATKIYNERHIYHGVVATKNINRLRNCMLRPNTFLLLNCAESEAKLKEFYDAPEYEQYKAYRHRCCAENDCCLFTLKPISEP